MKAAYLGYKAGHRDAVALSGALCTSPGSPYWETLFANDAAKFTDAFTFHTYAPIAACRGRIAAPQPLAEPLPVVSCPSSQRQLLSPSTSSTPQAGRVPPAVLTNHCPGPQDSFGALPLRFKTS